MSSAARRQHSPPPPHPHPLIERLQAVVDYGKKVSSPWATGISALDHAMGGGIPRGRITELTGSLAVGKSTLMRQAISQILLSGHWVAWIDATRTLAPAPWAGLGNRFVVIRPSTPSRSAWAADLLLRSGVFGLVVIDGTPQLSRVHGLRLAQLARDRDAACVVIDHTTRSVRKNHRLTGTIRLHIRLLNSQEHSPDSAINGAQTSNPIMQITVEKGGSVSNRRLVIEVDRVSNMAYRLCAHPEVPDRRGVARSTRRPWNSHSGSVTKSDEKSVAGGGIGIVTHDLYGIGIPKPIRIATPNRKTTEPADTTANIRTHTNTSVTTLG